MARPVRQPRDRRSIARRIKDVRRTISQARRRERYRLSSHSPQPRQIQRTLSQPCPEPINAQYTGISYFNPQVQFSDCIRMERTPSRNSVISDKSFELRHDHTFTCDDDEAARRVDEHFKCFSRYDQEKWRLWLLIQDLVKGASAVDDMTLDYILNLTDLVFFRGELYGRVKWEWSDPSQKRFETDLIGTTAVRQSAKGGYETLIILSEPILKHPDYDCRLLLSAFLHELVHCYLFIMCGFKARKDGGHTNGFHTIVNIIDTWAGSGFLRLCDTKANLKYFSQRPMETRRRGIRSVERCHDECGQIRGPVREYLKHVDSNPRTA